MGKRMKEFTDDELKAYAAEDERRVEEHLKAIEEMISHIEKTLPKELHKLWLDYTRNRSVVANAFQFACKDLARRQAEEETKGQPHISKENMEKLTAKHYGELMTMYLAMGTGAYNRNCKEAYEQGKFNKGEQEDGGN